MMPLASQLELIHYGWQARIALIDALEHFISTGQCQVDVDRPDDSYQYFLAEKPHGT